MTTEELPELHRPRLAALIVRYLLHHMNRTERKIMAAIDDLNAKVDELAADVSNVAAVVSSLRSAQGTPDDQVVAVTGKLQALVDQMNAIVAPPVTPVP